MSDIIMYDIQIILVSQIYFVDFGKDFIKILMQMNSYIMIKCYN